MIWFYAGTMWCMQRPFLFIFLFYRTILERVNKCCRINKMNWKKKIKWKRVSTFFFSSSWIWDLKLDSGFWGRGEDGVVHKFFRLVWFWDLFFCFADPHEDFIFFCECSHWFVLLAHELELWFLFYELSYR